MLRSLRPAMLRLVHGATGTGHFGVKKMLGKLRQHFYWPGCQQDSFVHCCDMSMARKGPNRQSLGYPGAVPGGWPHGTCGGGYHGPLSLNRGQ